MPARSRDGLVEDVQADGAEKLLLRQNAGSAGHTWEHIQREKQVGLDRLSWLSSLYFCPVIIVPCLQTLVPVHIHK